MMELFDFTYNSKNYREALKITKPPAVPYLGKVYVPTHSKMRPPYFHSYIERNRGGLFSSSTYQLTTFYITYNFKIDQYLPVVLSSFHCRFDSERHYLHRGNFNFRREWYAFLSPLSPPLHSPLPFSALPLPPPPIPLSPAHLIFPFRNVQHRQNEDALQDTLRSSTFSKGTVPFQTIPRVLGQTKDVERSLYR